ncbi:hypothetical protein EWM62_06870 [Mucilaginibacter terrigena]|uniref:Uncharacterized protein n=1 Tax=Mucilaginibacter terrigena TaxID=2492395 RepID=A0A4Q5LQE4_9SPHI|nr:hypothetical protein [Mucilaginibacter terrigena]RYU91655.1 hypothetical protein EWM62_06870 [Mucilaginibacter terrigena]
MSNLFHKFYRNFYLKTGGYIPAKPLSHPLYPGDFFQIRNGEMVVLGNVFFSQIIKPEDINLIYDEHLNGAEWKFEDGISRPYSGRSSGHGAGIGEFEFSKQVLAFADYGSFVFSSADRNLVRIGNWNDLQDQLIIKLTQVYYSFREVYVVTESASASHWSLAVGGSPDAELEIATATENFGLVDIFDHPDVRTIQSKNVEYYHLEKHRRPAFIRAKKLVVQDEKIGVFINELIMQRRKQQEWALGFYDQFSSVSPYIHPISGNPECSLLDTLRANELNANTALLYFKWADMNLDDVEALFPKYAN